MQDFWNQRYQENETVYGNFPNQYFKETIDQIICPGICLLPGDGEGRNARYAASKGWKVDAFDYSEIAIHKAKSKAIQDKLEVHFQCCDVLNFVFDKEYDLVALIYFHLPEETRIQFNKSIIQNLKKGGHYILEAFSKEQIHYDSGGPKNQDSLYDLDETKKELESLELLDCYKSEINLDEGAFHKGKASVIRIHGIKK